MKVSVFQCFNYLHRSQLYLVLLHFDFCAGSDKIIRDHIAQAGTVCIYFNILTNKGESDPLITIASELQ